MAKGIKERLEAACREAGLDGSLGSKLVDRVLDSAAAEPEGPDEAELARIRAEVAAMAAVEQEVEDLLGVTSRKAIVPALEAVLEKLKALKIAAGFDTPSTPD